MTRPAAAVTVALASPLAACAAAILTHATFPMAVTFAVLLTAAPIISPPHATERSPS